MASKLNSNSTEMVENVALVLMKTHDHLKNTRKEYLEIANSTTSYTTFRIYMFKYEQVDNQIAKIEQALQKVTNHLPLPC
jgi:hypothetical protein